MSQSISTGPSPGGRTPRHTSLLPSPTRKSAAQSATVGSPLYLSDERPEHRQSGNKLDAYRRRESWSLHKIPYAPMSSAIRTRPDSSSAPSKAEECENPAARHPWRTSCERGSNATWVGAPAQGVRAPTSLPSRGVRRAQCRCKLQTGWPARLADSDHSQWGPIISGPRENAPRNPVQTGHHHRLLPARSTAIG